MEPLDAAQSFIERSTRAPSVQALAEAFQLTLEHLGFRFFACCSHTDPLRPPPGAIILHTYPSNWAREFCERRLYVIDPVLLHAERTLVPFHWDAPDFLASITGRQREILGRAAACGLTRGYTVPIHMPWTSALRASCSVVPDSDSVDPRNYFVVQLMAMHLYEAARPKHEPQLATSLHNTLSLRERECLELVAQGKSDWAIGQILLISEHTVHRHIESAKRRLGVATRVQAIVCALQGRHISMGDVVRAEAPVRNP
jgi:DNA-binding CsgD family transcriptional regulator